MAATRTHTTRTAEPIPNLGSTPWTDFGAAVLPDANDVDAYTAWLLKWQDFILPCLVVVLIISFFI